jgi:hypothetical protein
MGSIWNDGTSAYSRLSFDPRSYRSGLVDGVEAAKCEYRVTVQHGKLLITESDRSVTTLLLPEDS